MFHYKLNNVTYVKLMNLPVEQLDETLGKNFADLSPKLQIAARYVMENQQEIATHSLRQIARRSGLTPPTFSRLARAVGFEEYEDMRNICRAEFSAPRLSLAQRAEAMQNNVPFGKHARGSFAEYQSLSAAENISALIENIDTQKLADVADELAAAESVRLLGTLSSKAILQYMLHMASLASPNWSMMEHDGNSAPSTLAGLDKDTVVMVISIAPYIKRPIELAKVAAEAGCSVVAITDDLAAPILKHASHSFFVRTESPQFFPSYVAVLTLLEILMGMVIRRLGEDAKNRIESVEKMSRAVGDYVE